jgi:hypothetical protein
LVRSREHCYPASEAAAIQSERGQNRRLDKAIRQTKAARHLLNGALLGNFPSLSTVNPNMGQRTADFRASYAIEKSADI